MDSFKNILEYRILDGYTKLFEKSLYRSNRDLYPKEVGVERIEALTRDDKIISENTDVDFLSIEAVRVCGEASGGFCITLQEELGVKWGDLIAIGVVDNLSLRVKNTIRFPLPVSMDEAFLLKDKDHPGKCNKVSLYRVDIPEINPNHHPMYEFYGDDSSVYVDAINKDIFLLYHSQKE